MNANVAGGLALVGIALVIGYTWYVGAWGTFLDSIKEQLAAGGTAQRERVSIRG